MSELKTETFREGDIVTCSLPRIGKIPGCIVRGVQFNDYPIKLRWYILEIPKDYRGHFVNLAFYTYSCFITEEWNVKKEE